jgi:AraC-like DNA-binding protein
MLGTRHEEYINFSNNIPFVAYFDIELSKTQYSTAVNWHKNTEIQICTSGDGYVLLDGRKMNITEGDLVIANSDVLHYTGTDTNITYSCIILDTEFALSSDIDLTRIRFEELFRDDKIANIFNEIRTIKESNDSFSIAKLRTLTLKLLILLCEGHLLDRSSYDGKSHSYKTVTNAITYIRKNYQNKLTLDEIAKNVFANKYTLTRNFKEMTGQTIVEYINTFRCNQAARLIDGGAGIAESARLCGFGNMSFFTKTFKQYIGCLPSEYKKR